MATMIPASSIIAQLTADLSYNPSVHVQTVEIDRTGSMLIAMQTNDYVKWFISKQDFIARCSLVALGSDVSSTIFHFDTSGAITEVINPILKFSNLTYDFVVPTISPQIQYGSIVTDPSYIGTVGDLDVSYERLLFESDGTTPATASSTTTTWSFNQNDITIGVSWNVNDSSMINIAAISYSNSNINVTKAYNDAAADFIQIKMSGDAFDPHNQSTSSSDIVSASIDYGSKFNQETTGIIQATIGDPTVTITDVDFTKSVQEFLNSDGKVHHVDSTVTLGNVIDYSIEKNLFNGIQGVNTVTIEIKTYVGSNTVYTDVSKDLTPIITFDISSLSVTVVQDAYKSSFESSTVQSSDYGPILTSLNQNLSSVYDYNQRIFAENTGTYIINNNSSLLLDLSTSITNLLNAYDSPGVNTAHQAAANSLISDIELASGGFGSGVGSGSPDTSEVKNAYTLAFQNSSIPEGGYSPFLADLSNNLSTLYDADARVFASNSATHMITLVNNNGGSLDQASTLSTVMAEYDSPGSNTAHQAAANQMVSIIEAAFGGGGGGGGGGGSSEYTHEYTTTNIYLTAHWEGYYNNTYIKGTDTTFTSDQKYESMESLMNWQLSVVPQSYVEMDALVNAGAQAFATGFNTALTNGGHATVDVTAVGGIADTALANSSSPGTAQAYVDVANAVISHFVTYVGGL